jgi:hypothetical protein
MNRQNVAKWCPEFEAGRSDVHDGGHPLSLMKSSKKLMKTFELTDVKLSMTFINNVQKCQELFSMAKRAGGRFLRRWNKKHSFPGSLSALCSAIHGYYVEKQIKVCCKSATS